MIIDLPSTSTSAINRKMVDMREQGGTVALSRVLTLVIVTDESGSEESIEAANEASFEHPCRVIVVARGSKRGTARMDAQIRVGGDAGASEVIITRLYGELADHGNAIVVPLLLPDAPVVAWWPQDAPDVPAEDPIGALAQRRITDSARHKRPLVALERRLAGYRPGDTDLTWTRLTTWRGLLAAALDLPPLEKVTSATVAGAVDSASADLLAGWLALQLRCPVHRLKAGIGGSGLHSVELHRKSGVISLVRPQSRTATLSAPGQPDRNVALARRTLRDCIAEELRRLDADEVYADVLGKGLALVAKNVATPRKARVPRGRATTGAPAKAAPAKAAPAKSTAAKSTAAKTTAAKPARARAVGAKVATPNSATRKSATPKSATPKSATPKVATPKAASAPSATGRRRATAKVSDWAST
jgi:glucose-6-phosphate dehydrogenase assembly protein OpcA